MKKYFTFSSWLSLLQKLGKEKQKIISPQLLKTAAGMSSSAAHKAVQRLKNKGYLIKLYNKAYANKFALPSLEEAAMLYGRPCYISFESALENYGVISQMPLVLTCATPRKIRSLKTPLGEIIFHHLSPRLFNNYRNVEGVLWASAEKALLDYLYIKLKKREGKASLDEFNLTGLNKAKLKSLSRLYPKSVKNKLRTSCGRMK